MTKTLEGLENQIRGIDIEIEKQHEKLSLHEKGLCRCHTAKFKCAGMQKAINAVMSDLATQRFNACIQRHKLLEVQKESKDENTSTKSKPKAKRKSRGRSRK